MQKITFALAFVLLAILTLPVSADPPASGKKLVDDKIPFMCFTDTWTANYKLVSSRYDRKKSQLIWVLETKKLVFPGKYEAFIGDGDGVQLGLIDIAFVPIPTKSLKPGTRVEAVVQLNDNVNMEEAARLTIRERR